MFHARFVLLDARMLINVQLFPGFCRGKGAWVRRAGEGGWVRNGRACTHRKIQWLPSSPVVLDSEYWGRGSALQTCLQSDTQLLLWKPLLKPGQCPWLDWQEVLRYGSNGSGLQRTLGVMVCINPGSYASCILIGGTQPLTVQRNPFPALHGTGGKWNGLVHPFFDDLGESGMNPPPYPGGPYWASLQIL